MNLRIYILVLFLLIIIEKVEKICYFGIFKGVWVFRLDRFRFVEL